MRIREGRIEDAEFLATVVMEAVGADLCESLAGEKSRIPLVKRLFTRLAAEEDSQYSYRNALIAETDDGIPAGGLIAYDGAQLRRLRLAFLHAANDILGWNETEESAEEWGDEADPGEIYIDSLYVDPEFRNKGVASALLKAVERKYEKSPKPLGLLVEPENRQALQKYIHWGFTQEGVSNFFRTPMLHMQK